MPTISKTKLKANMLRVFREIEASGEELIVTDRNQPGSSHSTHWFEEVCGGVVRNAPRSARLQRGRQRSDN